MAAYAALVTLMNLTDQIQNHPRHSFSFDEKQIESLQENVSFLLDFIEGYTSHGGSKEAEDLESEIAAAAHAAEDVIESQVVDQILTGSTINHGQKSSSVLPIESIKKKLMKAFFTKTIATIPNTAIIPSFLPDLQKVIGDMDSIKNNVVKVKDGSRFKDEQREDSIPVASSTTLTTGKIATGGSDGYLIQLLDVLTGQQCSRQIISIVGMGGVGKTTLAINAYEDPLIVQHFDIRAWATISQEYDVREILLQLLSCNEKVSGTGTVDQLGKKLYKKLMGNRYLIVLDDMWSDEVWDEIKFFFPDNGSRSRIVITTRLSNLVGSDSSFVMELLDEKGSWKLFCQKAFGEDHDCPSKLEKIGKEIVGKCRGLPLSIVVMGGHLRKSSMTQDYWKYVSRDINSILAYGDDEDCLNILYLSYAHLPVYLKPCFLYMGIFPEDKDIDASTLIKLWVAEGFLKPNKDQSLEEIAKSHLKDLVDRNLILVRKWRKNGELKTCNIHDLLRELCLRLAENEKFLCVLKLHPRPLDRERRVAIHGNFRCDYFHYEVFYALKTAHLVRSMICKPGELPFHFKLLKILKMGREVVYYHVDCLKAKFEQVNLRYLSRELGSFSEIDEFMGRDHIPSLYLPSSISQLWNLQTLIIKGSDVKIIAPSEIWEMTQLRHLEVNLINFPDPPPSHGRVDNALVMSNLQTITKVGNFKMSEEVCKRMPNIKNLEICYNGEAISSSSKYFQHNLGCFSKLDSLNCHFLRRLNWHDFALILTFPSSVRKLSLTGSCLDWGYLTMIGLLPNLEVLKLIDAGGRLLVRKYEWTPIEGEFVRLKHLKLEYYDELIEWNADSSHFPVLESLIFKGLSKLDEIPSGIGDIPALRCIYLDECSMSAVISAMRIVLEQEELGNEDLQLQVGFWQDKDRKMFREMMKDLGLTSNNYSVFLF